MRRSCLEPIVRLAQSLFDDSVSDAAYNQFLKRSMQRLVRAIRKTGDLPSWAGELRLALDNLEASSSPIAEQVELMCTPSFVLPSEERALKWFGDRVDHRIVKRGRVERFTAIHLIALLGNRDEIVLKKYDQTLEELLRQIEVYRKKSLNLHDGDDPLGHWYEAHDTAILFARVARQRVDMRFLNTALKLNDWALPVHRRSVPVDLLVRYVLALSEVRRAYEELV